MSFLDGKGKKQKGTNIKDSIENSPSKYSANEGAFNEEFSEEYTTLNGLSQLADDDMEKEQENNPEFKEEFSEDLMNDVSRFGVQSYSKSGVSFEKLSETKAKVNYSGLLAKNGANDVFGVYGFGSNQKWEDVSSLNLNKESGDTFTATIPIEQGKNINFAFKDSTENWDNNSGNNYTFVN